MGKDVLVIGATSQIGAAIASAVAANGGKVFLCGRNEEKLAAVADRLGSSVLGTRSFDYQDIEIVKGVIKELPLCNALLFAGGAVPRLMPFRLTDDAVAEGIMRANFGAPASFLRELLRARKLADGASCVFINSVAAGGSPEATAYYSAAKAALLSLLRSVGSEYARRMMRFNSVAYGYLRGETIERLGVTEERLMMAPLGVPVPAEVVGAPLFLLSDASRWITRKTFVVDGGVNLKQHWVI
jgi:NAD(P)-dependent dehydrogenase (short-subunit alcohol dehydrogenase family)